MFNEISAVIYFKIPFQYKELDIKSQRGMYY